MNKYKLFFFESISELVKKDENGLLFTNGKQLAEHLLVRFVS